MIQRPDIRWRFFSNAYAIVLLSHKIKVGSVTAHDLHGLVEARETLISDLYGDTASVGIAFFDQDELSVFQCLREMEIDIHALDGESCKEYLESPEFIRFVEQSGRCLEAMMSKGRGLPGWNEKDIQDGMPLY